MVTTSNHQCQSNLVPEYKPFSEERKRQPIRRRSRKIGRNEPCPCGRYKMVEDSVGDPRDLQYDSGTPMNKVVNPLMKRRLKYKNCCGHPDNQRAVIAAKYHVFRFCQDLFNRPVKKVSLAKKFVGLFKKNKFNGR